ncbi:glucose-1-phosphate cytidylyltransferase [[Clostridium] aminophilum]|uniref:glucose-1-phosphate cytidylyltransferase n=1 Tax=[Clostridium] aminophilum TaxID=1526 RepID=UPI00332769DE
MKVVLLAGGRGTRIMEESEMRPKPMIEIGGMPILWHIMKEYSYYGFNDFIICAGYKHYMIKKWFADYAYYTSDMLFDFSSNRQELIHNSGTEQWKVLVINTGLDTNTGGRIKKIQPYVGNEPFLMTYGDGVCDVNISDIVRFHKSHGKLATLTSVARKQTKGMLDIGRDHSVRSFREKSHQDAEPINAGYMVLEPKVFDYLKEDTVFESDALEKLADEGQLMSYEHEGFWQCMDTLQEKLMLEQLIRDGNAPWIKWE